TSSEAWLIDRFGAETMTRFWANLEASELRTCLASLVMLHTMLVDLTEVISKSVPNAETILNGSFGLLLEHADGVAPDVARLKTLLSTKVPKEAHTFLKEDATPLEALAIASAWWTYGIQSFNGFLSG